MFTRISLYLSFPWPLLVTLLLIPAGSLSADSSSNWRQGRIYYRMVCTACHKQTMGEGVSPMSRTIANWEKYFTDDKHNLSGKANPLVYYVGKEYRESIKATNKAAEKFIDMPTDELLKNVRAYLVHGAKDSDTPARCQ